MNRKLRTKLPSAEEHVTMHKLPVIKQKRYYDHGSNQLKPLETILTQSPRSEVMVSGVRKRKYWQG